MALPDAAVNNEKKTVLMPVQSDGFDCWPLNCAMNTHTHSFNFFSRPTQVVLEKRPLNGCVCVCVCA